MADVENIGKIGWLNISVDDAPVLRDFYSSVVGWKPEEVGMGEYNDFNMTMPASGEPTAGICHALGSNVNMPRQWLIYIIVADLQASSAACTGLGGEIIAEPRGAGGGQFFVIENPSGAIAALYQEP
jgi:predicted enzyme related to lactoylglutathione lyase